MTIIFLLLQPVLVWVPGPPARRKKKKIALAGLYGQKTGSIDTSMEYLEKTPVFTRVMFQVSSLCAGSQDIG
jgi:hypothetical protein